MIDEDILTPIKGFDVIKRVISLKWGTIELHGYLYDLINDTRNTSRYGFPTDVMESIVMLSNINDTLLRTNGLLKDEIETEFHYWKLPKNF